MPNYVIRQMSCHTVRIIILAVTNKLRISGPQNLRNQRNLRKTIFFFCKRRVNEIKEKLEELNTV